MPTSAHLLSEIYSVFVRIFWFPIVFWGTYCVSFLLQVAQESDIPFERRRSFCQRAGRVLKSPWLRAGFTAYLRAYRKTRSRELARSFSLETRKLLAQHARLELLLRGSSSA